MATSVENATLTVTVKEQLYLNGKNRGSKTTHTFANVDEVMSFIKTCPADAGTMLLVFDTTPDTGSNLNIADVKYIRLTNLDASVACEIGIGDGTGNYAIHKLSAGQSYVLMTGVDDTFELGAIGTGSGATSGIDDITSIAVHCYGGAAVDIEVFVASV
jgi:hypothetical protein